MEDSAKRLHRCLGRRTQAIAAGLLIFAIGATFYLPGASENPPEAAMISAGIARAQSPQPFLTSTSNDGFERPLTDRLAGVWTLHRHGEQTLTIRQDGTATADVKLSMLAAVLYGSRLQLDLAWTLNGDVMTQTIVSGTPSEAVQRLIRDWGDSKSYRVEKVTANRLVLTQVSDGDEEVWTSPDLSPADSTSSTEIQTAEMDEGVKRL
jgi:hypothetical protein